QENCRVQELADRYGLPVISGGDRHGCEPNAALNLTNAGTFAEFAEEIRKDAYSTIAFMPQYQTPLWYRKLRIAADVLSKSESPEEGMIRWSDRLCLPWTDGRVLPLSAPEWSAVGPSADGGERSEVKSAG